MDICRSMQRKKHQNLDDIPDQRILNEAEPRVVLPMDAQFTSDVLQLQFDAVTHNMYWLQHTNPHNKLVMADLLQFSIQVGSQVIHRTITKTAPL